MIAQGGRSILKNHCISIVPGRHIKHQLVVGQPGEPAVAEQTRFGWRMMSPDRG